VGDVRGQFAAFTKKVQTLHAKNGPFDVRGSLARRRRLAAWC
jgi:hypothetical protein